MESWIKEMRANVSKLQTTMDINTGKLNINSDLNNIVSKIIKKRDDGKSSQSIDNIIIDNLLKTTATAFDISIKIENKINSFRDNYKKPQNLSNIQFK